MPLISALRSIVFYAAWICFTILWFVPSLLAAFLLPLKARIYVITVSYSQIVLWLARCICGIKWELIGVENLPKDKRGYIILSKHQSSWETFFLAALFVPQVPVVKKELAYLPVFGWIFTMIQPIFIDRKQKTNALKQVLYQGKERLDKGISVTIFPEGTRVPPGLRHDFSRGGAMLATYSKSPVIAIAHNSAEYWPNNHWVKHPGTIKVVISPVLDSHNLTTNQLNDQVENWINQQVDTISTTPFSGEYSLASSSGKRF